jgi:hypothetical protein
MDNKENLTVLVSDSEDEHVYKKKIKKASFYNF